MMRPTDLEMTAMEKIICCRSHSMQGHTGKHQGQSGGRDGLEGRAWPRAFAGDFVGRNRQGRIGMLSKLRIGKFE